MLNILRLSEMGISTTYLILLDGPFGKTEIEDFLSDLNKNFRWEIPAHEYSYGIYIGTTKRYMDKLITEAVTKQGSCLQVMKSSDGPFVSIYPSKEI
jgi:hypothetical protein